MNKSTSHCLSVAIIYSLAGAVGMAHAATLPRLVSSDKKLAAFVDAAACEATVRVRFQAGSEAEFDRSTGKAARFIGNVTDLLKSQCPVLERVAVKGLVGERILYSGVAEAATDWVVVELGARAGSGILAQGAGKAGEKQQFAAAKDFVAASKIVDAARASAVECIGFQGSTRTCLARNRYSFDGSTISVRAEYLLNKDGTLAVAQYQPTLNNQFLCTDPSKVQMDVQGGKITQESRKGMQDLLLERLRSAGTEFCSGFTGTPPGALTTQSFGSDGSGQAPPQPSSFSADAFNLRIES